MFPFSRRSHTTLVAAVFAACFAPASVFAQGSFVPSGYTPTIQLKPTAKPVMGTDLTQPPIPTGVLPPKTSSRTVAPADVDYEIIDADGQRTSGIPQIVDDRAFSRNPSGGNPPAI